MKIIHISDLHLSYKHKIYNFDKLIALLEYITKTGFDHLVVTGDLTHTGEDYDFQSFRDLLWEFNLLRPEKTTVIIGNHDIFGGVVTAEDVINFPSACKNIDYNLKVKKFYSHFSELYKSSIFPDPESTYPFIKIINDVMLIGINSIAEYSLVNNPLASNGKIGSRQLTALYNELSKNIYSDKYKILLTHHHFAQFVKDSAHLNSPLWDRIEKKTMKLKGKKSALKKIKAMDIDMVLHGHIHKFSDYTKKGIRFLNAGDTIDNTYKNSFRLNSIEYKDGIIETERISSFIQEELEPVKIYF